MTSDSLPPSQELNYPPVQVDHSLTELDLETLMMRSLAPPRAEELGSSLDESTYELLGDSQFETSDDEGHTASIASTDDRTPDDASAFSGDDDDDDDFGLDDTNIQERTYLPRDESEHTLNMQSVVSGDSSILTEIPGHMEDSDSLRQIKLDERTVEHSDAVQGSKSVKSYWAHESPEVFGRYDCKELRLVVRAGLSQRPMPTPDAYRVLYIGKPDKWLEDTIVAKLSEALIASPSISKSVVVRGQVEPYNPTIHVWRCTEFQPVIENGDATHVLAILDDGQRLRFGPKLNSTTLGRPDLVVLCHPTISGTDKQDFARAEKVLKSEAIPCINIGQVRAHGDGSSTYDPTTLAMCVEGRDTAQEEFKLKEALPLDHFAFSQLDALQLNRHLASISPHLAQRHDRKGDDSYYGSWWKNASSIISKRFNGSLLKSLTLILLSLVIVPAIMQGVAYAPGLLRDIMGTPRRIDMNSVSQGILTECSIPTSKLATPPPAPDASFLTSARSELTLTPSQAEVPKRKFSKKKSASGQYEIKVMSDRQFVLDFKVNRKKPQLRISVARDSQVVPVQYNRMIDGEYVVDLVREYSSGLFNVSISTYSKPLLQQSFGVVLGHNRSRSDMLINTAMLHVQDTKLFFTNVSSFAIQYVKAGLNVVDDMALSLAGETEQLRNAQSEISSKILSKGQVLRGAPKAVWKGIRQATAPIRTSTPMIKARQNALRMRCNMETVAGFSGNSEKGESWACAKWREMDVGHER